VPTPADSRSCSPDGGSLLQSSLRAVVELGVLTES
jgi:hypothetical protein